MPADDVSITIPIPRPTSNVFRGNGRKEVPDYEKALPVCIRMTTSDRWMIDAQAVSLGMSFGEFVRWCAIYCAVEVQKEKQRRDFGADASKRIKKIDKSGFEE